MVIETIESRCTDGRLACSLNDDVEDLLCQRKVQLQDISTEEDDLQAAHRHQVIHSLHLLPQFEHDGDEPSMFRQPRHVPRILLLRGELSHDSDLVFNRVWSSPSPLLLRFRRRGTALHEARELISQVGTSLEALRRVYPIYLLLPDFHVLLEGDPAPQHLLASLLRTSQGLVVGRGQLLRPLTRPLKGMHRITEGVLLKWWIIVKKEMEMEM